MEIVLEVVEKGKSTFYKVDKDKILIGRSEECDITLQEDGSSKKHCTLEFLQYRYWVVDLDSKNGTIVNNTPIKRCEFFLDDVVQIGDAYIRYDATKMNVANCQKLRRPGKKHAMNKSITLVQSSHSKKKYNNKEHGMREVTGVDTGKNLNRKNNPVEKKKKS